MIEYIQEQPVALRINPFRDLSDNSDCIIIEDIDSVLAGKQMTQEEVAVAVMRAMDKNTSIIVIGINIKERVPYFYKTIGIPSNLYKGLNKGVAYIRRIIMKTKIVRNSLGFVFSVLPSVISLLAVINRSVLLAVLSVIGIYLSVAILPCARRYENIWVFFLSMFASIPFNIKLIDVFMRWNFIEDDFMLLHVMRCALIYVVLFCVEEIILAAIARFIWKKQKAILF